jgi:hypothetical protein
VYGKASASPRIARRGSRDLAPFEVILHRRSCYVCFEHTARSWRPPCSKAPAPGRRERDNLWQCDRLTLESRCGYQSVAQQDITWRTGGGMGQSGGLKSGYGRRDPLPGSADLANLDPKGSLGFSGFLDAPADPDRSAWSKDFADARGIFGALNSAFPQIKLEDNLNNPTGYAYVLQPLANDLASRDPLAEKIRDASEDVDRSRSGAGQAWSNSQRTGAGRPAAGHCPSSPTRHHHHQFEQE